MIPRNIDDKALAWKMSLFLLFSAFLSAAVNALKGTSLGEMFGNPLFQVLFAAALLSLLYWLLRNFNVPFRQSIAAVVVMAAVLLVIDVSGVQAYVVMSNSMKQGDDKGMLYHFWERLNYSRQDFDSFPIPGGFQAGDMLLVIRTENLRVGDVAADISSEIPVTHRIFSLNESTVMTVGDASPPFDWRYIQARDIRPRKGIYGNALFMIPKGGILKVLYYCHLDPECSLAGCFWNGECGNIRRYE